MATYKTPGVYVEEISLFPPSVAEVETAVPAFIGYTETAEYKGKSLTNQPTRISSMLEYRERFGGDPRPNRITVDLDGSNAPVNVVIAYKYLMYYCLQTFFGNGGGDCYIISVGGFDDPIALPDFTDGLTVLKKYDEPTMILFPDAVQLRSTDLGTLQGLALAQCNALGDRVAIMDVKETGAYDDDVAEFRSRVGINFLKYGAAYTPYLHTTLVHEFRFADLVFRKSGSTKDLADISRENPAVLAIENQWKSMVDQFAINIGPNGIAAAQKTIEDEVNALLAVDPIPAASIITAPAKDALNTLLQAAQLLSLDEAVEAHVDGILVSALPKLEADLGPAAAAGKKDKVQASLTVFSDLVNHFKENFAEINTTSLSSLIRNKTGELKSFVDNVIAGNDAPGNRTSYATASTAFASILDQIKTLNGDAAFGAKLDAIKAKLTALNPKVASAATTPANLQTFLDSYLLETDNFLKENGASADQIKKLEDQIPELATIGKLTAANTTLQNLASGNVERDRVDIDSYLTRIVKKLQAGQDATLEKADLTTRLGQLTVGNAAASTDGPISVAGTALTAPAGALTKLATLLGQPAPDPDDLDDQRNAFNQQMQALEQALLTIETAIAAWDSTLRNVSSIYANAVKAIEENGTLLPPSGFIAGVYTAVDADRGVWKAPANVSLNYVNSPSVQIDQYAQESLNVDTNGGKSINAIRAFVNKGTLVWGARTLAGNDSEWRYISVRRFFNMVEESVKKSTEWAVFEPNDSKTWGKVKGMIENYLYQKWTDGALAGARTDDAYFVKVGLGLTMSPQDVLDGRMIVEIGMAVVRPAEFIVLKFSHKLQKS